MVLSFSTCSYDTVVAETLIDPEKTCREFDEEIAELKGAAPKTQEIPVVRRRPSPRPRGA